jgi:hypothetical protein
MVKTGQDKKDTCKQERERDRERKRKRKEEKDGGRESKEREREREREGKKKYRVLASTLFYLDVFFDPFVPTSDLRLAARGVNL